jgi:sensor histidine kinase YesM
MIFACAWLFLAMVQAFVVYAFSAQGFGYLFIDYMVYNLMLACCTLAAWYPIRFGSLKFGSWFTNAVFYSVLGIAILLICVTVCFLIMLLITWGDASYLRFMLLSLPWRMVTGVLLLGISVLIYFLHIYTQKLKEKADNEIRLYEVIRDGELNVLKSQINPHFLFNGLNSVSAMILSSPEQAREMLAALSDYLRYTVLATKRELSSLQDEMENIERYLSIEKLRFREKLSYIFDIKPDCLSECIPSMLLLPLFENAIKHGVYERIQEVVIGARAWKEANKLYVEIDNDFDEEQACERKGSGTGLKNIKERLRLTYGHLASIDTKTGEGKFIVKLQIPLK